MATEPVADQPAMPETSTAGLHLRASDAEREQVVTLLSNACAEGRLTLDEMGGRVSAAYAAVTRADLEPLTHDLPAANADPMPLAAPPARVAPKRKRRHITVMGSTRRQIRRLGDETVLVTVMGESRTDLRWAVVEHLDIEVKVRLVMGEQVVIVPDGVDVEVTGFVFMGEKKVDVVAVRPRPGVPRLHIHVVGVMGEVRIRNAKPGEGEAGEDELAAPPT
jgi:hypothetical protein